MIVAFTFRPVGGLRVEFSSGYYVHVVWCMCLLVIINNNNLHA